MRFRNLGQGLRVGLVQLKRGPTHRIDPLSVPDPNPAYDPDGVCDVASEHYSELGDLDSGFAADSAFGSETLRFATRF